MTKEQATAIVNEFDLRRLYSSADRVPAAAAARGASYDTICPYITIHSGSPAYVRFVALRAEIKANKPLILSVIDEREAAKMAAIRAAHARDTNAAQINREWAFARSMETESDGMGAARD